MRGQLVEDLSVIPHVVEEFLRFYSDR